VMATAIACDLCETEQAVMMQTSLSNGDTISVGQACMLTFFGGSLAEMLDNAGDDLIAMYQPTLNNLLSRMVARTTPIGELGYPPDASVLSADPDEIYEDGNTEYGIEQAQELNDQLAQEGAPE
jgi:hypothetical protein